MSGIGQAAERRVDFVRSALVFKSTSDQLRDISAPFSRAGTSVQISDQLFIQGYMYTHVPRLTHNLAHKQ